MDWESLFKRYVWDDRTTPYLITVAKLNRQQANNEILAYTLFLGILFGVVAITSVSEASPHGRSPLMALYGFSVVCAAILFQYTKALPAALYLAATPLAGLLYLFVFGLDGEREPIDTAIVAGVVLLLLLYSLRVINLARAYPMLPESTDESPRRRLFK